MSIVRIAGIAIVAALLAVSAHARESRLTRREASELIARAFKPPFAIIKRGDVTFEPDFFGLPPHPRDIRSLLQLLRDFGFRWEGITFHGPASRPTTTVIRGLSLPDKWRGYIIRSAGKSVAVATYQGVQVAATGILYEGNYATVEFAFKWQKRTPVMDFVETATKKAPSAARVLISRDEWIGQVGCTNLVSGTGQALLALYDDGWRVQMFMFCKED